jgi:hypothetical protein
VRVADDRIERGTGVGVDETGEGRCTCDVSAQYMQSKGLRSF